MGSFYAKFLRNVNFCWISNFLFTRKCPFYIPRANEYCEIENRVNSIYIHVGKYHIVYMAQMGILIYYSKLVKLNSTLNENCFWCSTERQSFVCVQSVRVYIILMYETLYKWHKFTSSELLKLRWFSIWRNLNIYIVIFVRKIL